MPSAWRRCHGLAACSAWRRCGEFGVAAFPHPLGVAAFRQHCSLDSSIPAPALEFKSKSMKLSETDSEQKSADIFWDFRHIPDFPVAGRPLQNPAVPMKKHALNAGKHDLSALELNPYRCFTEPVTNGRIVARPSLLIGLYRHGTGRGGTWRHSRWPSISTTFFWGAVKKKQAILCIF